MKIAICSDSHDNLVNISRFLHYCNDQEIETIIHCGDWCAPSVLEFFRENFKGKIYGVYGNVHADDETMQKFATKHDIILKDDELEIEVKEMKMAVTHYPEKAIELAKTQKYDIVFYGHNHKPWMDKVEGKFIVNPGTLAGMFQKATFAVYDYEKKTLDLKLVEQI
ncbi:YfcE family phosphodiesterase [Candidatus Falkowbacteria bacterium]|jgi:uncharacterized protein|nr:YfcE family phosphodiesterase [Candidatus Falkowbacteria bacterium]MBT5503102.1 YfcE family phosphodiesterase [Candidatus Falkowbacteria bacterium]MBT6574196.1 YfcE family phosphodiesterase [Candidatus Falkowbacteria bacterium]MBT7348657.1 YfcE family phosphodiesterase [Candidatus Falkowbacteria bacterium]MBT7500447.1 YfcE family phosphodiesterase [Candidatus Falkowbacteria bacterium]